MTRCIFRFVIVKTTFRHNLNNRQGLVIQDADCDFIPLDVIFDQDQVIVLQSLFQTCFKFRPIMYDTDADG